MYHYQYVNKQDLAPIKNQIISMIHDVQDELRKHCFTFQYDFIGSVKRNIVTYDPSSNIGFDFDVNIEVNDDNEEYTAKEIKIILMNTFDKYGHKYWYCHCEDNTRVFTVKVKDRENSRIVHSCDFAIVNNYGKNNQQYIRHNKTKNSYEWTEQPIGFYKLANKIEFCKDQKLWNDVRDLYLEKKNFNTDPNKKSRSIFAETINEICTQLHYKGGK